MKCQTIKQSHNTGTNPSVLLPVDELHVEYIVKSSWIAKSTLTCPNMEKISLTLLKRSMVPDIIPLEASIALAWNLIDHADQPTSVKPFLQSQKSWNRYQKIRDREGYEYHAIQ
jgi:hypothetical protein